MRPAARIALLSTACALAGCASPPPPFGCPDYLDTVVRRGYPREALRQDLGPGTAEVEFTLEGNVISNARLIHASHPVFGVEALAIVREMKCFGRPKPVQVRVPFAWRID